MARPPVYLGGRAFFAVAGATGCTLFVAGGRVTLPAPNEGGTKPRPDVWKDVCAALAFSLALVLYGLAVSPRVATWDVAEMQMVPYILGIRFVAPVCPSSA